MSGVSFPVTRPCGRALLVGNPASRAEAAAMLGSLGYACDESDDPYTALAELYRQPGAYAAVILSLTGFYKEELQLIRTIKGQFPRMDVWLAQTDGRHGAMAEAMRLGADGLLAEDGLHRIGIPAAPPEPDRSAGAMMTMKRNGDAAVGAPSAIKHPGSNGTGQHGQASTRNSRGHDLYAATEPVLSPEELRALLHEQPFLPPHPDGG